MGKKQVIESLPPGTICLHGWGLTHPMPTCIRHSKASKYQTIITLLHYFMERSLGFWGELGKGSHKMRRNEGQGQKRATQEHHHLKTSGMKWGAGNMVLGVLLSYKLLATL